MRLWLWERETRWGISFVEQFCRLRANFVTGEDTFPAISRSHDHEFIYRYASILREKE